MRWALVEWAYGAVVEREVDREANVSNVSLFHWLFAFPLISVGFGNATLYIWYMIMDAFEQEPYDDDSCKI